MKLFSTLKINRLVLTFSIAFCMIINYSSAQCIYFKKISTGPQSVHVVAIAKDGTLWAWGSNQFGQVGNNSLTNVSEPVQINSTTGWKDIATGDGHSLAIDAHGKLWGWGADYDGQLGDGQPLGAANVMTPKQIISDDSTWKAVAACGAHSMGLTADGKLWVWGYGTFYNSVGNINTTPLQVGTDTDWVAITTGAYHFIAIKKDSTLWAWGRNGEGEAGDSTTTDNNYFPPREIDSNHKWTAIVAGSNHTLALQKNGTLWSWGNNTYGELGDGTTTNGMKGPKQVGTAKYSAIGAGTEFSLAVSKDSLRWAWGYNLVGQFGNDEGSTGFHISTVPLLPDSSKHWVKVYGSENVSYNLTDDGTAWSSGDDGTGELGVGGVGRSITLIKVGTPNPYTALATSGASDVEYQRGYNWYAANCNSLITLIFKTGDNPIHANTTAKVWIDDSIIKDGGGTPYLQRHYEIHPADDDTKATGTVIFYFTQAEFNVYNASVINTFYPMLPTDSIDAAGNRNHLNFLRLSGISGDGTGGIFTYTGSSGNVITPTSVTYQNGRWEATLSTTGFGGFFASTGAGLLPVTWLNVSGILNSNNQALLNWKVNEFNTSGYNVEKSNDGISFNSISSIISKGNGENTYQYTDNLKIAGSLFYRIKQTDKDGKSNYSNVIALNSSNNSVAVNLFPNPANDHVFIKGLENNITYHVVITDMAGKEVLHKEITGAQNEIFTSSFSKGVYLLKLTAGNYSATLKFVKQ